MKKKVPAATTQPLCKRTKLYYNRQDKSDLGPDFVAPDCGWAWLVCIAAGVANLSLYPCMQQFGILFREHLETLGISSSQMTTIINTNAAVCACSGLLNGSMFRRFTFRQVITAGALLAFNGIVLTAFCETFAGYMCAYSLLYGFGLGIAVSASTLAINTYFQQKRRRASGFSWTITGLGPIFLPHLVDYLLEIYGVWGTVLIVAAITLHALISAIIYEPVRYHLPKPCLEKALPYPPADALCAHCAGLQVKPSPSGIFSSQYLWQEDDVQRPGYEITEPGTPMLSRANDGWYGSGRRRFRTVSSSKDLELPQAITEGDQQQQSATLAEDESSSFLRPNYFRRERVESNSDLKSKLRCTCAALRAAKAEAEAEAEAKHNNNKEQELALTEEADEAATAELSLWQKLVVFFDLDLLRDVTYVNLVIGLTIVSFGETNFTLLTPFILADFGLSKPQITMTMSVMASMDMCMRFLVPFITEKIPWDNRVFYLIGVVGIAIGRTIITVTRSHTVILACFAWMGVCKGVRTIFWPLIIPGYIPLNRLPAASGLQLLITGLFSLICGPFVGLLRDRYDYSATLHCFNAMTFLATIFWIVEALLRRRKRKTVT
ncbi:hypothetical protein KR222_003078 [Zaprionus bogoriensis]|nr:hypothetical protein KR222_003078 [Zaprionus bogoriensis]